jgi:hypothetical protein
MAYMVYARYSSAVVDAYRGAPDARLEWERARAHREWLQSLRIADDLRSALVEQARAIEEAFEKAAAPGA